MPFYKRNIVNVGPSEDGFALMLEDGDMVVGAGVNPEDFNRWNEYLPAGPLSSEEFMKVLEDYADGDEAKAVLNKIYENIALPPFGISAWGDEAACDALRAQAGNRWQNPTERTIEVVFVFSGTVADAQRQIETRAKQCKWVLPTVGHMGLVVQGPVFRSDAPYDIALLLKTALPLALHGPNTELISPTPLATSACISQTTHQVFTTKGFPDTFGNHYSVFRADGVKSGGSFLHRTQGTPADAQAEAQELRADIEIGEPLTREIKRVGVIGGGTAGHFAALRLKKAHPELEITLIESSKVPIIGVGEATTPTIIPFLEQNLGISRSELYAEVRPTPKLGIRFEWGLPGDYHFNYPFGPNPIGIAAACGAPLNQASLESALMERNAGLITRDGTSLEHVSLYAWHLENRPFVGFLHALLPKFGIERRDAHIVDAIVKNGLMEAVVDDEGKKHAFDFFVDCTGFRSLLLEQKMGSEFVPYNDTLLTDSAAVGTSPHGGLLKPYTTATTMKNGWCWNTPVMGEDHVGYVFSSDFCSDEEASKELLERYPECTEPRFVRFRCGRHAKFMVGNVAAIGNSFAFVEPLESTGIHMITDEVNLLAEHFPTHRHSPGKAGLLNRLIAGHWDFLRWFLGVHFAFNKKIESPFWTAAAQDTNLDGVKPLLALFKEMAPLSMRPDKDALVREYLSHDRLWGLEGLDTMFYGQGVRPDHLITPILSPDTYLKHQKRIGALADTFLPAAEATAAVHQGRHK